MSGVYLLVLCLLVFPTLLPCFLLGILCHIWVLCRSHGARDQADCRPDYPSKGTFGFWRKENRRQERKTGGALGKSVCRDSLRMLGFNSNTTAWAGYPQGPGGRGNRGPVVTKAGPALPAKRGPGGGSAAPKLQSARPFIQLGPVPSAQGQRGPQRRTGSGGSTSPGGLQPVMPRPEWGWFSPCPLSEVASRTAAVLGFGPHCLACLPAIYRQRPETAGSREGLPAAAPSPQQEGLGHRVLWQQNELACSLSVSLNFVCLRARGHILSASQEGGLVQPCWPQHCSVLSPLGSALEPAPQGPPACGSGWREGTGTANLQCILARPGALYPAQQGLGCHYALNKDGKQAGGNATCCRTLGGLAGECRCGGA
ncbi:spidroin-2-like [Sapajus apella]|uniref:Spidroin-2-like n=1 Tax=Sapajus apella TaxID=9515 RepID=A0A6J3JPT0_SAPAP|nr:spidroin-2-like [Sapajus apella]